MYHVCNRGSRKGLLFTAPQDYIAFLRRLAEALALFDMRILAYCLMPNHWHFMLWPRQDGDLSEFMHWLTGTHAGDWRRGSDTIGEGAVYQSRFRGIPILDSYQLVSVRRYVERNPVAAHLVRRAQDWRWSSAAEDSFREIEIIEGPCPGPADWLQYVNADNPEPVEGDS